MTQRVEVFFSIWREELNLSCFPIWLKELNFFQNAQGIEPLSHMNYFLTWLELNSFLINTTQRVEFFHKKWLKALNTFLNLTERVEPFLHWTQRIELFFQQYDSKNWAFFCMSPKLNFLKKKEESPSQKMTQRIDPFRNMTHSIEPFFSTWLKEWFFFFWLTQKKIELDF